MSDPRKIHPQPPFDQKKLSFPGLESDVHPAPDFGEGTYQGSGKLKDRVALITGGDSGIGRAVAYAFACEGANVVISYLPEEESDAKLTQEAVQKVGQKAVLVASDIRQEANCQQIVQTAIDSFGKLDILVNNAAYQMAFEELEDITEEELDRTFRTNIYAMFFLTKAAWPHLKSGAVIINTASVEAYKPSPLIMPYAATKAAIANFTKSLAHKAIEKGIRVNAVAPGPIWTPLNPMSMPKESVEKFGAQTWTKRPRQPIEVAKVFVFLASDDASYVIGHIYGVTGGMDMPS